MRATLCAARRATFVSMIVFLLVGRSAEAVTKTWNGSSSANWSDGANWTPLGAPVAGDDLSFPDLAGNPTNINNLAAGTSFNSITFSGGSGGYTLNGNAIQLGAGGMLTNISNGFNVVALDITLTASQTFQLAAEVDLNGGLNLGANDLVVDQIGKPSFFQGIISGSGSLTKNGLGTLVYAGTSPNTLTGFTTVKGGTLRFNKPAGVVAIAGPLVIGDGTGNDFVSLANNEQIGDLAAVTIDTSGTLDFATFGATAETIGSLAGSGRVDTGALGVLITGGNNDSTTFSGVISGGGSLTKLGSGFMVLTGANTHTGSTSVMSGGLTINGSEVGPVVVANAAGFVDGRGTVVTLNVFFGSVSAGFAGPGIFNVTGDAQIDAGATNFVQIFGPTAPGYDQLNVTGTVTLGGNLGVGLLPPPFPPFVPPLGSAFTIVNNGGTDPVVGTFAGLPEGATLTVDTTTFRISYVGGTGNDVVLTSLTGPTPSPTPTVTPTSAPVPMLSFPMMLLLVLALGGSAVFLIRRDL